MQSKPIGKADIAFAVAVALIFAAPIMPPIAGPEIVFAVAVVLIFVGYMLPGFVAHWRKHPQENSITALNLLFGWTAIGWALALIWALAVVRKERV